LYGISYEVLQKDKGYPHLSDQGGVALIHRMKQIAIVSISRLVRDAAATDCVMVGLASCQILSSIS